MKAHYEVLDGLRGTAAICVVVFHILELVTPDYPHNPMHHAFLAVDFFFLLSGFVVGYAYDERMAKDAPPKLALSFWEFAKRRLIRLHPAVIVAAMWGLIWYLNDPFVGTTHTVGTEISLGKLLLIFGLSLFLLPTPGLPGTFGETHSLNGPTWTLFLEYIANAFYGLFGHKLSRGFHIVLCIIAAVALLATALSFNLLVLGWDWNHLWMGYVRLAYPFLTGLLIYRLNLKLTVPQPYVLCSALLIAAFMVPCPGDYNGLLEAGLVILVFPTLVMMGAGIEKTTGWLGKLCRFTGQLSYPLYIIHYPLIYVFGHWAWTTHPSQPRLVAIAVCTFVIEVLLATVLLYAYDLPVRAWLSRKFLTRESHGAVPRPISVQSNAGK